MIDSMPRFSDLWTGGELVFNLTPMPPSVVDMASGVAGAAELTKAATPSSDTQPRPTSLVPDATDADANAASSQHHSNSDRHHGLSETNAQLRPAAVEQSPALEISAQVLEDSHAASMDALWQQDFLDWDQLTTDGQATPASAVAVNAETTLELSRSPVQLSLKRRRRALVWFRQDLRLHDNLALHAALQLADVEIIPIYVIHKPVKKKCGPVRFQFVLECLHDLKKSLRKKGSDLIVLRGEAIDVLRMVLPAWGVTDLFYEEFVMKYATARDDQINQIAKAANVNVHTVYGRTLFDPQAVLKKNDGRVPTDFSRFVKIVQQLPQPPMPVATPTCLPPMESAKDDLYAVLSSFCHHYTTPITADALVGKGSVEFFSVPELAEFDHPVPAVHAFLYGGETEALRLLDEYCAEEERVGLFEKPRTSPACTDKQSTTTLSAHVTFGCLSPREFFYRIMFIQLKFPGRQGPPPVTLDGQLMWREFFYCFGVGVPSFDTQDNNPMCMQINWKLQELPTTDSSQWSDETKVAMEHLTAWREGRTGYPWIDAVLRQIEQEGWAHHVARHAVACFLTRGDLYISWLRGAYFFQEKLIDLDWAINIGNWLWVSSSCFFHDYHQIHSPSLYVQAWDPKGDFIRKWVPALKNMPARYIFEPWKAPLSVQRTAGCLIGKDYPFPIIDHVSAMKRCVKWLDGVHEKAHGHDGVLTPCCNEEGKPQCHLVQKKQQLEQQQQSEPPRKRPRS